ncbi:MAG: hypothetical protein KTR25_02260 [Myxococcales bacterium]|nr:hypothetical protein [Myxococcales bacterium]
MSIDAGGSREQGSVLSGIRACLLTQDRKLIRAVTRTLVPRRILVDRFDEFPTPADILLKYGFVLVDSDIAEPEELEHKLQTAGISRQRLIFFSHTTEGKHLASLLGKFRLANIIAKNGGIREEELLVTMHKLLTGDFFGVGQYLTHGTIPIVQAVRESTDRSPAVASLVGFLEDCLVSKRFIELARNSADELLMNALHRAPAGLRSRDSLDTNAVDFAYACDGRYVGISVSDSYGSLTEERLYNFLSRCFNMNEYEVPADTSGAGLGLYVVFRSADQLVVNIAKDQRTEVISLMDIRGRMRDFEGRNKSFHLFFGNI